MLVAAALLGGAAATAPEPLVTRSGGVEIDWAAGAVTASGGAAADLHLPSAELARPGAVRRAEVVARERLTHAFGELPLGGGRRLGAAAVARAVARARMTGTDYQSNGGALVRVTARFVDWLDPPPAQDAPVATLAISAMHLDAAPLAKVGDAEHALGAAVYRLGAPPADVKTAAAKLDRAGRLVIEGKHTSALAEKLASGVVLIYVGKVLR